MKKVIVNAYDGLSIKRLGLGGLFPDDSHFHCVDAQDNQVPIFKLYNDGINANDSVLAYLLTYTAHQTHSVSVGAHANFMFTTTMNGCTLGIGPNQATGTRRISHSNVGGGNMRLNGLFPVP